MIFLNISVSFLLLFIDGNIISWLVNIAVCTVNCSMNFSTYCFRISSKRWPGWVGIRVIFRYCYTCPALTLWLPIYITSIKSSFCYWSNSLYRHCWQSRIWKRCLGHCYNICSSMNQCCFHTTGNIFDIEFEVMFPQTSGDILVHTILAWIGSRWPTSIRTYRAM